MTNPGGTNPEGAGPMTGPDYPGSPYQSQTTMSLQNVNLTQFPVTQNSLVQNVTTLNQTVDQLSQYLLTMQEGIDQSQEDIPDQIQTFVGNLDVLFGNGALFSTIDFGDLQYFLPVLGALFGFNSSEPFPIDLFDAAEEFILGYVFPLDVFQEELQSSIDSSLESLGISQTFIDDINNLLNAFEGLSTPVNDFFTALQSIMGTFGITDADTGPFAELWNSITQLFSGNGLAELGSLLDPVFNALAPWVQELTTGINNVDLIIEAFSGDIQDIAAVFNFTKLFDDIIDLVPGTTTNLLSNPDFASGTSDWDVEPLSDVMPNGDQSEADFNPTYSDTVGDTAAGSMLFDGNGNSWITSEMITSVSPGDAVTGSFYYIYQDVGEDDPDGDPPTITVQIAEYGDYDPEEGDYVLLDYAGLTTQAITGSDGEWTQIVTDSEYNVGSETVGVAVMAVVFMPNAGSVWVTNFSLSDPSDGATFDVNNSWTALLNEYLSPVTSWINQQNAISTAYLDSNGTTNMLSNPTLLTTSSPWNLAPDGTDFAPQWNTGIGYNPSDDENDTSQADGSIEFSGSTNSWALSEQISVVANQPVEGTAYYLYTDVGDAPSTNIILQFFEYDSNGDDLNAQGATAIPIDGSTTTWNQITASYNASAEAAYVALQPTVELPSGGTAYFSDFTLTKSGAIQDILVPGIDNIIGTIITSLGFDGTGYDGLAQALDSWNTVVNEMETWWNELMTDLGFEPGSITDLTTYISQIGTETADNLSDLLSEIFGSADFPALVYQIPQSGVQEGPQNFQPLSTFPSASALIATSGSLQAWFPETDGAAQWSYSSTAQYDSTGGSAVGTANGTLIALDGVLIGVQQGQVIDATGYVTWANLDATADSSPIQLQLIPYSGGANGAAYVAGDPFIVTEITDPTTNETAWQELVGNSYIVPSDNTVTGIQLRLVVTSSALSGTVYWSNVQCNVTGGWISDLESAVTDITASFSSGGTMAEFETGVQNFLALFDLTNNTLASATNVDAVWTDVINYIINPLNALSVDANNIFGSLSLSSANINGTPEQLLYNGSFQDAISIAGLGIWTWTGDIYYTQSNTPDQGSATLTLNGKQQILLSNVSGGTLQNGQTVTCNLQLLGLNMEGSGTVVEMLLIPWIGSTAQTVVSLDTSGTPSGSSIDWTGAPVDSVAETLSGSYEVPENVTAVQMKIVITSSGTSGQLWLSAASMELTGGWLAELEATATDAWNNFIAGINAFSTLLNTWFTDIENYLENFDWSTFVSDLDTAWSTYVSTIQALTSGDDGVEEGLIEGSSDIPLISTMLNAFANIDIDTGLTISSQVSDITVGGVASSISDTVQSVVDGINNASNPSLGSGTAASLIQSSLTSFPQTNITGAIFARVRRTADTSTASVTSSYAMIPENTFDTTMISNDNITFVNGNSFTAAFAGIYFFNFSVVISSIEDITAQPVFFINSDIDRVYPDIYIPNSLGTVGCGSIVMLAANDTITPGLNVSGFDWNIAGDSTAENQNSMELMMIAGVS